MDKYLKEYREFLIDTFGTFVGDSIFEEESRYFAYDEDEQIATVGFIQAGKFDDVIKWLGENEERRPQIAEQFWDTFTYNEQYDDRSFKQFLEDLLAKSQTQPV